MTTTDTELSPSSWTISLLWAGISSFSIYGGILLGTFLNHFLWRSFSQPETVSIIVNPVQRALIIGLSIGGVKGFLERLILQKYEVKWKGWLPISMLAWAIGIIIAAGLPEIRPHLYVNALLGGLSIGSSQWIIVRRHLPKAYWWIIASVVGSFALLSWIPLGYTFLMILLEGFIFFIITGLFMGIMTGTTLSWLLTLAWLKEH